MNFNEKFEIISFDGTLSKKGVHLHISIADSEGKVFGGNLLDGCTIYTTAEVIVGEIENLEFSREYLSETGFKNLNVTDISLQK